MIGGRAVEPLEYLGLFLLRDARAGIGDIDAAEQLVAVGLYRDGAADGGLFDSVVQQIAHRLRCPLGVKDAVTL